MFEATRQGGVFLAMVYAGLLCGVIYDVLRAIRRMTHAGRLGGAALDLIFWLSAAAICAGTLLRISHEPVRPFALLGALAGMLVYLAGVSALTWGAGRALVRWCRRMSAQLLRKQ